MRTRHEWLRECWEAAPERFDPESYAKAFPFPVENGWEWRPWPEESDIAPFAREAAKTLLLENPLACPLDICDFATVLRRKYILESLGLGTDPESLNVVRIIEMLASDKKKKYLTVAETMEEVAKFCLNAEKARGLMRNLEDLDKDERAGMILAMSKGAKKLDDLDNSEKERLVAAIFGRNDAD